MSNWEEDDAYCTQARDYQDARAVAQELGIVLHRVNFAQQYRERVFQYLLEEYRAARTPNPDILCNREIKFGLCQRYATRLGGELFATGHYARRLDVPDGPALYQGHDTAKDQSYFLHAVERSCLRRVLFPLGELHKAQVRERARRAGRISNSGLERHVATSYVLLQARLPPDRVTPPLIRNLLGAELQRLLWPEGNA